MTCNPAGCQRSGQRSANVCDVGPALTRTLAKIVLIAYQTQLTQLLFDRHQTQLTQLLFDRHIYSDMFHLRWRVDTNIGQNSVDRLSDTINPVII